METFEFNQGWPCFQNLALEEAELKEMMDTIGGLSQSLYFIEKVQRWVLKFFQPSLAVYYDGEDFFKKLKTWEVHNLLEKL